MHLPQQMVLGNGYWEDDGGGLDIVFRVVNCWGNFVGPLQLRALPCGHRTEAHGIAQCRF